MVLPDPIVCLDALTDTTYMPGEEWTQTRIFQKGPTAGMEGQFRSVNYFAYQTCVIFSLLLGVNVKTMALYPVAPW